MTRQEKTIGFVVLAILTAFLYVNSLKNSFSMDDYLQLVENPLIQHPENISRFSLENAVPQGMSYFRPLTLVFRSILYAFFKNNAFYYHLTNVILLFIACSSLFILFYLLTKNFRMALFSAALFCSHPQNTTLVNFITANENLCFGIFCIWMSYFFIRFLNEKKIIYSFLSLAFYFAAMFCQEIAGFSVGVLFAIAFLWHKQNLKLSLRLCGPYLGGFLLYFITRTLVTPHAVGSFKNSIVNNATGALDWLLSIFRLMNWYLSQLFVPEKFVFLWSLNADPNFDTWKSWGIVLCLVVLFFWVFKYQRNSIRPLALLWFFTGFLPLPLLMSIYYWAMGFIIEPHWFFFSSAGFFLFIGSFLTSPKYKFPGFLLGYLALAVLIIYWGGQTIYYNTIWATNLTYGKYWLEVVPDNMYGLRNLGQEYLRQGNPQQALIYFQRILAQGKEHSAVYSDIAQAYLKMDRLDDAYRNFMSAFRLNPANGTVANNIGIIFVRKNNSAEAEKYFKLAINNSPKNLNSLLNLSDLYIQQNRTAEAIDILQKSLKILRRQAADRGPVLGKLAICYYHQKQYQEGDEFLNQFMSENSNLPAFLGLSRLALDLKASDVAEKLSVKMILLFPDILDAYLMNGFIFAEHGMHRQAVEIWKQGLEGFPGQPQLQALISKVEGLKTLTPESK